MLQFRSRVLFTAGAVLTVALGAAALAHASVSIQVAPKGAFNVNDKLKLAIELTAVWPEAVDVAHRSRVSGTVAERLRSGYPKATALDEVAQGKWEFSDGITEKAWTVETDGDVRGKPIVEVTTPFVASSRVDIFDRTLAVFGQLGAEPSKEFGGGHTRVRIKKDLVTPAQVQSFLNFYYSWFDLAVFSFRHERRSHLTAAPTMEEKAYWDPFVQVLPKLSGSNRTYADLGNGSGDTGVMDRLAGFLRRMGIIKSADGKAYDKYFDLNLGRLYATYADPEKESLFFEFRFFDAPRTADEARLHLKFMKAMFNVALNSRQPFERKHQGKMTYWRTRRDAYERDLREFIDLLGLSWGEYSYLVELRSR